jgi:hypothetical protein
VRCAPLPWLAALALAGPASSERIYVFCPSMAKPNAVQGALQAKFPGDEVTVFARLADFSAMVTQVPPDVIVAPKPLAEQFPAFKPFLRGTRKGSTSEEAVLISVNPVDVSGSTELFLGVVGILDRRAMGGFVQGAVGFLPKLKMVTKLEDLLPLLTFGSADAILVGESQVEDVKGRSQAALRVSAGSGKMPMVVAASRMDASGVETSLRGLGAAEKKMLGVDGWTK